MIYLPSIIVINVFIYFNIIDTELKSQSTEHEGDNIGMSEMEDDSDKQKPGFTFEKLNLEQ